MVFWFINYTMWGITASIFNLYCLQRRIKNDYRLKEYFHSELKILITLTLSSTHQGEKSLSVIMDSYFHHSCSHSSQAASLSKLPRQLCYLNYIPQPAPHVCSSVSYLITTLVIP